MKKWTMPELWILGAEYTAANWGGIKGDGVQYDCLGDILDGDDGSKPVTWPVYNG